jgi:hypothetical protein
MVSFRMNNEYILAQPENWPVVLQCLSTFSLTDRFDAISSDCWRILYSFTSSPVCETNPEHRSQKSYRPMNVPIHSRMCCH